MRVLCVAEKPSISKAITEILSGGRYTTHSTQSKYVKNYEFDYPQTNSSFIVTCVSGHLTEHDFTDAHRKWQSCEPADLFDAPVESRVAKDKKTIESNLRAQARRVDTLMIWTDCDREGEHIGMEIATVCRNTNRNIVVKRARFSAIIAQQIHRAAQHPVELDQAQADAVEARILLDLKIGAAFTRMQTMSLQTQVQAIGQNVVSYGPCQFPTLGFVVQRFNQVKNFVPEDFWYIFLSKKKDTPKGPQEITFNWRRGHLFDEAVAAALYAYVLESPIVKVIKVTNKDTKKWKPLPLTTVELQKAGSRLLKMAPKKVLGIAEKLYQQGFVSYPRTETDQFDPQFDFMALVHKQTIDPNWGAFARDLEQGGFDTPRKGKHDDKAHPPIHPTAHAGNLTGDEEKVYEYITRRFLAGCSKDAEGSQTTVQVVCGGEFFSATGLVIRMRNYLEVYPYDKWCDHPLPEFTEFEEFRPTSCELKQGQTSKPNLLTEADLVSLMDKNGIGTDATIAQHIQTIIDREYVLERMEGSTKYLVPSTLGIALVEGYDRIGLDTSVSKPQLRRETERRMVQVCERTVSKQAMLDQALEQYKEMFRVVKNNWGTVVGSVRQYLQRGDGAVPTGNVPQGGNGGNDDGNDDGNDGNGGNGGNGGGGRGGGAGSRGSRRGRGGRGGGGASAPTSRRARGGRAGGTNPETPQVPDFDMNDDPNRVSCNTSSRQTVPTAFNISSASRSTQPVLSGSTTVASSGSHGASSQGVLCECGIPAVKKTNTSGVTSIGKPFYMCFRESCGFWKWADDSGSSPSSGPVVPTKRTYTQTDEDSITPVRKCKCDLPGELLTVQNQGKHHGRKYWKCKNKHDVGKCDFFEWDDEPPRQPGVVGKSGGIGSRGVGSDACFTCGQVGHWSKDCPNQGGNGGSNKRPRSFGTGIAANEATTNGMCFKCDQKGHFASACPGVSMGRSTSTNTGSAGGSGNSSCYKCGRVGHWSHACPGGLVGSRSTSTNGRGTTKSTRGRKSSSSTPTTTKAKRGRGGKKSAFGAADGR